MDFVSKMSNRKLLQSDTEAARAILSPPSTADNSTLQPVNDASSSSSTNGTNGPFSFKPTTSPFDSSMALTILVLLTALFFMGFFSVYIRRFAAAAEDNTEDSDLRSRRRNRPSYPPSRTRNFGSHHKGLDPTVVGSLPLVSYGEVAKQGKVAVEDCTICLSEFEENEVVKIIPYCKHVFHPKCVDTWLEAHVSCPLCRSTQLFKKATESDANEVCLNIVRDQEDGEVMNNRETILRDNNGVRRACSCSNLTNHVVLHRSTSF